MSSSRRYEYFSWKNSCSLRSWSPRNVYLMPGLHKRDRHRGDLGRLAPMAPRTCSGADFRVSIAELGDTMCWRREWSVLVSTEGHSFDMTWCAQTSQVNAGITNEKIFSDDWISKTPQALMQQCDQHVKEVLAKWTIVFSRYNAC